VGCLEDGCEASLLVLAGDPSADLANTGRIVLRMKDGLLLQWHVRLLARASTARAARLQIERGAGRNRTDE
jgi:hypothetical protein